MGKILLKAGEILDLPLQESLDFIAAHADLIEPQKSDRPMPKRRKPESIEKNLTYK
jgi:hypothetical protein